MSLLPKLLVSNGIHFKCLPKFATYPTAQVEALASQSFHGFGAVLWCALAIDIDGAQDTLSPSVTLYGIIDTLVYLSQHVL